MEGGITKPVGNPFFVNVVLESDDTSDYADRMQYEYLLEHPEHPQAQRFIAEYEALRRERGLPLDWPRECPPPKRCLPVRGETVDGDSARSE
jgi:hypothetical protein